MSVWKVYEGVRYCAGVNEHTLKRYKRIRENREKLVELGLATSDEPLDCYQSSEWKEHTVAYTQCKFLRIVSALSLSMSKSVNNI